MPDAPEVKPAEVKKNDLPSLEDQKKLEDLTRKLLNPNGENNQVESYITSTFGYIQGMFQKMKDAPDSDKAANEIAEDLKQRFEGWANAQKADREERKAIRAEENGKTSEKSEITKE